MKKTLRLIGLCALVMLAAVSCKKNEEKNVTFQATLTQPSSDSKTHIDANNNLVWNSGDQIKVYTADNTEASAAVFSTTSNNTMTATFSGTLTESASYTAFYPAEGVTVSGSKILMPLNATQTFVDGNMASGAYPMYATGTGETFTFHSPAGLMMLKFMGSGTIGSVELTDKNGANLAGNYEVDPANNTCTFVGNATTVTLNCGEGVALNTETETVMYFVLPAGVFDGGFTAVVKNTTGGEMYTLSTTRANLIVAEKILEMPTVNVAAISVTTGTAVAGDVPTTMTLNGSYSVPAGMNVSEVGFYWGQGADLTEHQTATLGTNFSLVVEGLTESTEYSYYAYAKNGNNVIVGETLTFTTGTSVTVPTVTTGEVTNIASTSAMCGAQVTSNGGATVTQRGICWSVTPNPTLGSCSENHFSDESFDPFELSMNGLSPNTTYYVRAFATNSAGTAYGEDVSFTTSTSVTAPTVTTVSQATGISGSSAICGGTITNDGNGTISAYGICYSTTSGFAGENGTHVAGENLDNGDFSVVLNGLEGSTQYYFRAYAENSAGRTYGNQSTFITLYPGLLNGMFTITGNHHVSFSKGNLQYTKSTAEWSFMGHQYDIVEELNQEVGTDYANQDVVSLFGWGTSGYYHGTTCYQPWCTSEDGASYFVNTNLNGNADWGYNAITNGGNTQSQWKTLTSDEWAYIFNTRGASTVNGTANARYAKAMVNGIYGMILFPDVYTHPSSVAQPVGINQTGDAGWNGNNYTIADFALMEANGAVFLPVAGRRDGSTVQQWVTGYYWSRSYFSLTQYYSAEYLYFDEGNVKPSNMITCWRGLSVRLVKYMD